jgi:hypothetical protein
VDPALGGAGIEWVDLKTGRVTSYATGLAMANGVVRTAKGVISASDAVKPSLDRVRADGRVDRGWLTFGDASGLALGNDDRFLYANRSPSPTRVVRIDLRRPSRVATGRTPPCSCAVRCGAAPAAPSAASGRRPGRPPRPRSAARAAGSTGEPLRRQRAGPDRAAGEGRRRARQPRP